VDPTILLIDASSAAEPMLALRPGGEAAGHIHAASGTDGLMLARAAQPDLVLLEAELPDVSGFEVCERLKGCPETWSIPVIFVSAVSDVAAKVRAFECGAVDYVTKPFEPAELRARVRTALRSKQCQDVLADAVRTDALTGLWNRAHFEERLAEELSAWKRYARQFAILLLDLDNLRAFNERHGHPAGDLALQMFGDRVRSCLRKTDTASRYGGDQVAILLREGGMSGAAAYARRLRKHFETLRFGVDGAPLGITTSIGVAASELWVKGAKLDVARMMARVDFALYVAKHGGRNRVELATAA
jgi:two-component system, cell cycle response regulator